jgi:hypothetical protein
MRDTQPPNKSTPIAEIATQSKADQQTSDFDHQPAIVSPRNILNWQHTIGNQAVMRRLATKTHSRSNIQRSTVQPAVPVNQISPTNTPAAAPANASSADPKAFAKQLTINIQACYAVYQKNKAANPAIGEIPGTFAPVFAMIGGKTSSELIGIFLNVDLDSLNILAQFLDEARPEDVPAIEDAIYAIRTPENFSGAHWAKRADENGWISSKSLSRLTDTFRTKVEAFKTALEQAGVNVVINCTFRHTARSWLMHYAWQIGFEKEEPPSDDPWNSGIIWDHGSPDATKKAAQAMAKGFGMSFTAAIDSNHIGGDAIDLTITWSGDLTIKNASGEDVVITSEPRHGGSRYLSSPSGNTDLHAVGATYGVKKYYKDPPHWSLTGH